MYGIMKNLKNRFKFKLTEENEKYNLCAVTGAFVVPKEVNILPNSIIVIWNWNSGLLNSVSEPGTNVEIFEERI